MPDKKKKNKKQGKVRDLKPKKDAKGGSFQWGSPLKIAPTGSGKIKFNE